MGSTSNDFVFYVAMTDAAVAQSYLANANFEICFEITPFC